MLIELVQLPAFTAKWDKLRLTDEDLQALELIFIADPEAGDIIPGTGGLRKVRFAPPSWHAGKRGASRVIYAFILSGRAVYLFTIYGKNQQSDITADEKKVFRRVLAQLQAKYKS